MDAANVRRSVRAVCEVAGVGPDWTPRELRLTFVSLMSDSDGAVGEIGRLVAYECGLLRRRAVRRLARFNGCSGAVVAPVSLTGT